MNTQKVDTQKVDTQKVNAQKVAYSIADGSELDEMSRLLGAAFSRRDPPAVALGITAEEFETLVRLFQSTVAEGLTPIPRSADTGRMVGALLTEDWASPPPDGMNRLGPKFDPIFDLLGQLDHEYLQGKIWAPNECLHLFLLGVDESSTGAGIAQGLVAECLKNGARRGYRLAVTEATNPTSQHVFRKQGFIERVRRSYRDHRYGGEAFFASIESYGGTILMDRRLTDPSA
jgi:GNAT superfamily N-acetyltransferase